MSEDFVARKRALYSVLCAVFAGVTVYVIVREADGLQVNILWTYAVNALWAAVTFVSFARLHGKLRTVVGKSLDAVGFSVLFPLGLLVLRTLWKSLQINQAFRDDPLPLRVFFSDTLLGDGVSGVMRYVYAHWIFLLAAMIWIAVCRNFAIVSREMENEKKTAEEEQLYDVDDEEDEEE